MNKIVKLTNALLVLLLMMAETPVLAQKSSLSQSSVSQPSVKPSRIWSELATGYTSAQMIKVEKVLFIPTVQKLACTLTTVREPE